MKDNKKIVTDARASDSQAVLPLLVVLSSLASNRSTYECQTERQPAVQSGAKRTEATNRLPQKLAPSPLATRALFL
jgi:hypothetical protein